ncbi:hypothetical protein PHISCL_09746 [Aspergillus sclerotialis]|uniref:PB1 domain-containing protein n=1 Tax=Aspergillus sclerotialis TaxID=2070753 RepID=A0A3A2Z4F1_9EURO|nr:hypothetical protein PHISCL_09746 [Aspergillus sclerotialis]
MSNVTDIVCLQKTGSYRIQIFWKGDPGVVDNFVIRYQNEDVMRKWYTDIDRQRALLAEQRSTRSTGTSETEFTYMKNMANMPNPYQQEYDEELATKEAGFFSEFPMSRNASSTSLRTRSATGGSGGSGHLSAGRPPRFPMPDPNMSVHTHFANGGVSPAEKNMAHTFLPLKRRPRDPALNLQGIHTTAREHLQTAGKTTPGIPLLHCLDHQLGMHHPNGRGPQRPSLPPFSGPQGQANGMAQRMRSASSPDIHNHNVPESRRYMGAHTMQTVDNVPVPPIPAHMANMKAPVSRSQNNSPTPQNLSIRTASHSSNPQAPYDSRHMPPTHFHEPQYSESSGSTPVQEQPTSPLSREPGDENFMPTQLKAKVNFDDNYVTLVIASNILFRSLIDRVDAKLARFTDRSIGNKSVRLRYRDEDGDFVTIDSDEAVQLAFMEWREQHRDMLAKGQVGEIQLYCQAVEG